MKKIFKRSRNSFDFDLKVILRYRKKIYSDLKMSCY